LPVSLQQLFVAASSPTNDPGLQRTGGLLTSNCCHSLPLTLVSRLACSGDNGGNFQRFRMGQREKWWVNGIADSFSMRQLLVVLIYRCSTVSFANAIEKSFEACSLTVSDTVCW